MQEWIPIFFNVNRLYLLPLLVAVLIFLRIFKMRRREVLAGSLLIWRRLAEQQSKVPPRRKLLELLDRSLFLQCAAVSCLLLAFANPSLVPSSSGRVAVVLMLDNGPQSRAKVGGAAGLERIKKQAAEFIERLEPDQDVLLCRSAPLPSLLSTEPLSRRQALIVLQQLAACISGSEVENVWLFASDTARGRGQENSPPLPTHVISLQAPPQGAEAHWHCVAPASNSVESSVENVGIVAFGSARVPRQSATATAFEIQLLVRLKNFSASPKHGKVILSSLNKENLLAPLELREITLSAGGDESLVFVRNELSSEPLRIDWQPQAETGSGVTSGRDDFSDDDTILLAPRTNADFKIRFNTSLPVLEDIYSRSLEAHILARDDSLSADLEIYFQTPPKQIPAGAKALLLVAPTTGYRGIFEVGATRLKSPEVQRDQDDPLTRQIGEHSESCFFAGNAVEILRTGDYRSLLKDRLTGRTLVARFQDEGRAGYLLAFVPGAGMPEGYLLSQSGLPLYTLLIRIAKESAGLNDPYSAETLSTYEAKNGQSLQQDWVVNPLLRLQLQTHGGGLLDERVSALRMGAPSDVDAAQTTSLVQTANTQRNHLAPWLALLSLLLISIELWLQGLRTIKN